MYFWFRTITPKIIFLFFEFLFIFYLLIFLYFISIYRLIAKCETLSRQVAKGKADAGLEGRSKVIIADRYAKAALDYKESSALWQKLTEEYEIHLDDFHLRKSMWSLKLKSNAKVISKNFDTYLQSKGFAGKVKFDHKNHTLHLTCQTDNTNDESRVSDVRQLSGGERSYTTLCLLLALGHVVRKTLNY